MHRIVQGFFLWGKTTLSTVSVKICVQDETACVCVRPSGVCNLCFLCLLPGCDAEGRCDGNLPLFKSTAGTSKPAAAGITEIIRHKHLIYIKMLINLVGRAEMALYCSLSASVMCVCRLKHISLVTSGWGVGNLSEGFHPHFHLLLFVCVRISASHHISCPMLRAMWQWPFLSDLFLQIHLMAPHIYF